MNPSDPEPEPYRNLSRRQLIDWIQSLTIESAKHRRGKRYWKNYAQQLEELRATTGEQTRQRVE